jgi:hypothetical protein
MSETEIIKLIKASSERDEATVKKFGSFSHVALKTTFWCVRTKYSPDGHSVDQQNEEFQVDIFDSGTDAGLNPKLRYRCETTKIGERTKRWDAAESIERALANIQWYKLDD